jgi:hypothetical protein
MKTNCRKRHLTFGEFIMAAYDACGRQKAEGIVRLAVNARLVEFRGHDRFAISERNPEQIRDPMNPLLEAPALKAESVALCLDDDEVASKEYQNSLNQGGPVPLWLVARARTMDFRRGDLVRTHWKKIGRSMVEN